MYKFTEQNYFNLILHYLRYNNDIIIDYKRIVYFTVVNHAGTKKFYVVHKIVDIE